MVIIKVEEIITNFEELNKIYLNLQSLIIDYKLAKDNIEQYIKYCDFVGIPPYSLVQLEEFIKLTYNRFKLLIENGA